MKFVGIVHLLSRFIDLYTAQEGRRSQEYLVRVTIVFVVAAK